MVVGEIETKGFVVVENRRVDGAVHESEDGVRRRRNEGGLDVGQDKVVVGLKDGAGGHGRVVDGERFGGVIDGLYFVAA